MFGVGLRAFSLVGRIDNGPYFQVGSSYFVCFPRQAGRLYLAYWDGNNFDNSGTVQVEVSQ